MEILQDKTGHKLIISNKSLSIVILVVVLNIAMMQYLIFNNWSLWVSTPISTAACLTHCICRAILIDSQASFTFL